MPTIGLSMIVKDEAHVIARCLDSLRCLIDAAVIVDTGSIDGTQRVLRNYFAQHGIDGKVVEEPWRNFAHNRSSALAALRQWEKIDYALVIDADDSITFEAGFDPARFKANLDADIYDVDFRHGGTTYRRPQIFRNTLMFRYKSVLHEYLEGPAGDLRRGHAAGFHIIYGADGGRSRDPDKYCKDAAMLERELQTEADPFLRARYTFYLGQSYRDCGQRRPAIDAYLRRAELGFWDQEVFESLLNAGRLMADDSNPTDTVMAVLNRASAAMPERAEAIYVAARICRERGENRRGVEIAARGLCLSKPSDGLFLQPWVYETGLLDEFAINAYWSGRYIDSLVACAILLSRPDLDEGMRDRVRANRDFAYDRLEAQNSLWVGTLGKDRAPRIAVVTPYFKEAPQTLWRCIDSVKRQTVKCDHILVADGHPQAWLDGKVARHIHNDQSSGDAGDTPRALGSLLAASANYTAICFLDADCWYDNDHVELCLRAALKVGFAACGLVTASRTIRRTDLSTMPLADESSDHFVDTNCYFFLPKSFGLLPTWGLWPRRISAVGDRMFLQVAASSDLPRARTQRATVNYVTTWAAHYRALGELPPAPVKENPDHSAIRAWIESLPVSEVEMLRRQLGADVRSIYDPVFRAKAADMAVPSTSPAITEAEQLSAGQRGRISQLDGMKIMHTESRARSGWSQLATAGSRVVIVSFYMENVSDEVVGIQRRVVESFNDSRFEFKQVRTTVPHGDAIDDALKHIDGDILIFLDIDCVPLHRQALPMLVEAAGRGVLVGCAQKANHIQNGDHLYAGPFCMGISKALWNDLGQPSARSTDRGDVAEEITYRCEELGRSVQLIWPSYVEHPIWPLRPTIKFGYNTVYGGAFLHAFGIRHEANRQRFIARGQALLTGVQAEASNVETLGASTWGGSEGRESDKGFWHRFTETYDRALGSLGEVRNILEFGVLDGDSIRWLMNRFPRAQIVGVDISPQKDRWPIEDRIEYKQLDQGDNAAIQNLFKKLDRQFDLIIDDGSHIPQHQATCLLESMPYLRQFGFYFLEDIHSSHPDNADFRQYMSSSEPNALHLLLAFEHIKATAQPMTTEIASNLSAPGYFRPDQVISLFSNISHIEIYRRSVLPLRCYRCGSEQFDYRHMLCYCGVDLYKKPDSMTCVVEKA